MKAAQASVVLFAFWLVLSGSLNLIDLAFGLILSVLFGVWAAKTLWAEDAPVLTARQAGQFVLYIPHLLKNMVVSALQVAEVVLDPRMPIDPIIVGHRTPFKREVTRVAYANSITLTPGTLTVDVENNTFYIHGLAESFTDEIASGELEQRLMRVFEE